MSCGPANALPEAELPRHVTGILAHEGFRLFFPLSALYAALWPVLWVLGFGFDLPLVREVPPTLWHGHEMIIGAYGAALLGFLTTAAAEWTDTEPPRGRALWALAGLWGLGRAVGLLGWDRVGVLGALADLGWMLALLIWLLRLSWQRQSDRLLAFAFWLVLLMAATGATRWGFLTGQLALAETALHLAGFSFLGLLGLALARITVPVTNLVLDPSERSSPFRPHPGRLNLAPGLVLVAMAGEVAGLSPAVSGYLIFAAGAAFMDRVAEGFIGRQVLRSEILMLAGASACAGAGLMMAGAARLGAPWAELTGLHLAFLGGLGLGVYAVFSIAALLHAERPLQMTWPVRLGATLLVAATALRIAPDLGIALPGPLHGLSALAWAGAFALWLMAYWPVVSRFYRPAPSVTTGGAETS